MKLWPIYALWLAFAVTSSPIPGQATKHPTDSKSNIQSDSTQENKPAPTPLVVNSSPAKTDEDRTQAPSGQDKPRSVRITELPSLPRGQIWMDRIAWGASILLVIIAGIGIWLANRTLNAIQRQADLQEAGMRQWVDVELVGMEGGTRVEASGEVKPDAVAKIKFKAINNTSLPFTVKKIVTNISRNRSGETPGWEVFEVEDEAILPPSKDEKESSHPFFVPLDLDEAARRAYLDGNFMFSASGRVFFEPAVGRRREEQSFGYVAVCGPNKLAIFPYAGKYPRKGKYHRQNPN